MTASDSRLEGGKEYSLKDLFSGDNNKIVIPDLQRDYCWETETNKLVGPFVDSLLALDKTQGLTLGLIYGYYDNNIPGHLQLCDGQQRITTLFLLVGMLNRILNNRYKSLLISNFELSKDDCEPYLQYAIRESSLYFISDLVVNFFLKEAANKKSDIVENIKRSYWYLNSYDSDPTITCILRALQTINKKLENISKEEALKFGDFISGYTVNETEKNNACIKFLYYDMVNRMNGEETFVVINTTGEPLSPNQNIKPLIINEYKDIVADVEDKWEEMETWFWQHRDRNANPPHTADEGMSEFFRCCCLYYSLDSDRFLYYLNSEERFPYKNIHFDNVYALFNAYREVYEIDYRERDEENIMYNNPNNKGRYAANQLFSLLPTLKYRMKYPKATEEETKRIYHLFHTVSIYQDISNYKDKDGKNHVPVMSMMEAIDEMTDSDILCLKNSEKINKQERLKLQFIDVNKVFNRSQVELFLARAEHHKIFKGRLQIVLSWCDNDFETFKSYMTRIFELWNGECDHHIDILRRALLTKTDWIEYPIIIEHKSCRSLGWSWDSWFRFFNINNMQVKDFIDKLHDTELAQLIRSFEDIHSPYYPIIKDETYLKKSYYVNLYDLGDGIIALMEKERGKADYCLFIKGIPFPKKLLGENWSNPWKKDIYISCNSLLDNTEIRFFNEPEKGSRIELKLGQSLKDMELDSYLLTKGFNKENMDGIWRTEFVENTEAIKILQRLAKQLEH